LKELERLKKQKIQEILDAQNATIDASMVRVLFTVLMIFVLNFVVNLIFKLMIVTFILEH
jgi:phage shock protein PspC (stress-responsive transcriptional regulator)